MIARQPNRSLITGGLILATIAFGLWAIESRAESRYLRDQLRSAQARYKTLVTMTNKAAAESASEIRAAQETLATASATIANQDLLIDILYLRLREAGIEARIEEAKK